nr:MAG TPA: hypothetical protein [Caudoviricetes sp.]
MLLSSFIRFLRRPPVGVFYYSKHHRKTLQTSPKPTAQKAPERNPQPRPATRPPYLQRPHPPALFTIKRNAKNTTAAQNAEKQTARSTEAIYKYSTMLI